MDSEIKEPQVAQADEPQVEELDIDKLKKDIIDEVTAGFTKQTTEIMDSINKLTEQVNKKQVLIKKSMQDVSANKIKEDLNDWVNSDILQAAKTGTSINLTGLKKVK